MKPKTSKNKPKTPNRVRSSDRVRHQRYAPLTDEAILDSWFGDGTEVQNLCRKLELAIRETLSENAHLADGEQCTLIKLKRAVAMPNA